MPSALESEVKKEVKALLKELGCWYFMPVAGKGGKSGVPDFVVCCNGEFIGIETKREGQHPTPLQKLQLQAIKDSGGLQIVVRGTSKESEDIMELKKLLWICKRTFRVYDDPSAK